MLNSCYRTWNTDACLACHCAFRHCCRSPMSVVGLEATCCLLGDQQLLNVWGLCRPVWRVCSSCRTMQLSRTISGTSWCRPSPSPARTMQICLRMRLQLHARCRHKLSASVAQRVFLAIIQAQAANGLQALANVSVLTGCTIRSSSAVYTHLLHAFLHYADDSICIAACIAACIASDSALQNASGLADSSALCST